MPDTIDTSIIEELKSVMGASFGHLVEHFIDDTAEKITRLEESLNQQNWYQAARIGHSLKSSAHQMGAVALAHASAYLEFASNNKMTQPEELDQLFAQLKQTAQQTQQYYTKLLL